MADPISAQSSSYTMASINGVANETLQGGSIERILPRQISTGSMRGTQIVGYGAVKIDGSNNTISITAPSTSTTINVGVIPTATITGVGLSIVDSSGFTLFKMDGQTWYWYDKTTTKNVMQIGKLPDGTYGTAIAKSGFNVQDAFS